MEKPPAKPRRGKKLLVASVGVATVSFMALQVGCEGDDDAPYPVANLLAPVDASTDYATIRDATLDAAGDAQIDSGRLLPLPPSANLLAIPLDASMDAIVSSGNLLPPMPSDAATDAASDAAQDAHVKDATTPKDAKVDTGLPISGNLIPIPPDGSR